MQKKFRLIAASLFGLTLALFLFAPVNAQENAMQAMGKANANALPL